MPRLNRQLADELSTTEIVVDTKDGEDVTVKIRALEPRVVMKLFNSSKGLREAIGKSDGEELTQEDVEEVMAGKFDFGLIADVVAAALVDPKVVENPQADNEVTIADVARYQLTIFGEAMKVSGFGGDVETFRPQSDSDSSGDSGTGVRAEAVGNSESEQSTVVASSV